MALRARIELRDDIGTIFADKPRVWRRRFQWVTLRNGRQSLRIRARYTEEENLLCFVHRDGKMIMFLFPLEMRQQTVGTTGKDFHSGKFVAWGGSLTFKRAS